MRRPVLIMIASAVILTAVMLHPCKAAEISDAKAIVKILMFRIPPTDGETGIAVIYDKTDPSSINRARRFAGLINSVDAGNIKLKPFIVDKHETSGLNATAAYLTEGTEDSNLFESLSKNSILSISSNDACIKNRTCVLSITNTPKVRIKMNVAAAEMSNVKFQSVFRMMIQEF